MHGPGLTLTNAAAQKTLSLPGALDRKHSLNCEGEIVRAHMNSPAELRQAFMAGGPFKATGVQRL